MTFTLGSLGMWFWYSYKKHEKKCILGTNLLIMIFMKILRLNISIYTSLDRIFPEVEVNYP